MARTSFVDVALRLRGARRFNAEVAAASKQLDAMGVKGATALSGFAQRAHRLQAVGRSLTMGLTLPIVGIGAVAGKMAIDFSEAVNQIETQAGVGAAEVERMRTAILDYAKSGASSATPKELADGMFRIASAGLRGAEAIDALRKAEELATVGRVDMETASSALAAAVQTGIKGTENFDSAIGVLNATVGAGNMRMNDLVSAMGTGVVSAAKVSGLSFDQLGASIAFLTSKGQPAQASATRLAMTFAKLSAPTDKAAEAMEKLGLQPLELAKMLNKGQFPQALRTLRERLDGLSEVEQGQIISDMFGGGRSSRAILTILDDLDGFEAKLEQIQKKSGTFGDALASTMEEPGVKWERALAQISAVMIELGDNVGPLVVGVLKDFAAVLTGIATGFSKLPKPVRLFFGGLVLLAAILGPIIWMVGALAKGIGVLLIIGAKLYPWIKLILIVMRIWAVFLAGKLLTAIKVVTLAMWRMALAALANPYVLIAVAIIAFIGALVLAYHKVEWFRNFINKNWKLILAIMTGGLSRAVIAIVENFGKIRAAGANTVRWLKTAFNNFVGFFRGLPGKISAAASGMFDGLKDAFRDAIDFILNKWNDLKSVIPDLPGVSIPGLADGGTITRPGTVMVGERGPELLSLPRGASVIPLSPAISAAASSQRIEVPVYLNGRQIALAVAGEVADAKARS